MNKKEYIILSAIILLILGGVAVYFLKLKEEEGKKVLSFQGHSKYQVYSIDLPKNMEFAGEAVPLEKPGILERLDQEIIKNTYHHSSTILVIKRANRYFPDISRILKQLGLLPRISTYRRPQ